MNRLNLKAKWGALPVWAWGAIAGVVGLIVYYFWARTHMSDGVATSGDSATAGSNLDAMGYQTSGIKGGSATTQTPEPQSNLQWLTNASRGVALSLAKSPSEVYNALYKYLSGQDITRTEQGYVDTAIRQYMNPPEGTQGVGNVIQPDDAKAHPNPTPKPAPKPASKPAPKPKPKPAPKPKPKPAPKPATTRYTVKRGDNLSMIAQRFYGRQDWQKIYNANRSAIGSNPNLIHAGLVLTIPK